MEAALPILLDGTRLAGEGALTAGLADALSAPGDEVAKAESWLLNCDETDSIQPWDRPTWSPRPSGEISAALSPVRKRVVEETRGRYPAPVAILDCLEYGLPQCFDGAIRSEMAVFAHLIQRPEPRNMIQTLFLGKTDYDRATRKGLVPDFIAEVVAAARAAAGDFEDPGVLARISHAVERWSAGTSAENLRMADYAIVEETGYPGYLGGPFTYARNHKT
jgi:3-hydroxyacyl-CoA dehydrogenase/enoyl-CoA hydratase/3-hydroxybutyryl-CoA epimerase